MTRATGDASVRRGRRRLLVLAVAFVLSTSGTTAITVAVAAGHHTPQPERTTAGRAATADRHVAPAAAVPGPPLPAAAAPARAEPGAGNAVPALPPSHPVAIDIPAIGVRSPLQRVGLTADRTMQMPAPGPHYNEAAWYEHSVGPGSPGPAIIVGHVDSAAEGPSVFFDLAHLQQGDEILVARADGLTARFQVDTVDRYAKADFPTSLVYGETDRPALRLITCGGAFDRTAGHYLDNVVVFATLVGHD